MSSTFSSLLRAWRLAMLACLVAGACATPAHAKLSTQPHPTSTARDSCSWDRPGVDPFMGDVVAAVDRYTDIPLDVRQRLKERMAKREYDDLVSIQRDRIVGDRGQDYNAAIRDMHFGAGSICHTVSRDHWTPAMQERGLVYCERNHCILVPTVCRNVSRIARRGVSPEHAEGPDEAFAAIPPAGVAPAAIGPGGPMAGPGAPLATDGTPTFAQAAAAGIAEGIAGSEAGATGPGGASGAGGAGGGGIGGAALANQAAQPAPAVDGGILVTPPTGSGTPDTGVIAAVPEPATWGLLVAGLLATLGGARRRRASQAASSGLK